MIRHMFAEFRSELTSAAGPNIPLVPLYITPRKQVSASFGKLEMLITYKASNARGWVPTTSGYVELIETRVPFI